MSLLVSPVNAESIDIEAFVDKANDQHQIIVTENTVVTGKGTQSGDSFDSGHYEQDNNSLYSDAGTINSVIVQDGHSLTFEDVALDSATIVTKGKLTIKNNSDEMRGGLFLVGNIKAGELEIDTTQSSGSKGIYANTDVADMAIPEGMEKKIIVDVTGDISVSSAQDAVFTEGNRLNSIELTSQDGNIQILAQDRGAVYNNVGTEAEGTKNNLSVVAEKGNILIESQDQSSDKKYGGVINKNEGKTTVKAENGSIAITSSSQGVFATNGNIEITSQQNQISAGSNGVTISGGQVDLKAQASSNRMIQEKMLYLTLMQIKIITLEANKTEYL